MMFTISMSAAAAKIDSWIGRAARSKNRLIGLAIFRVIIGLCGIEYYLSDIGRRYFLWSDDGYIRNADAQHDLAHGLFSIYLWSDSRVWFNACFFGGLLAAGYFTITGSRAATLLHAVFLWSIYNRNQDLLEGGDNLVRIVVIFMLFASTNYYLAPRAKVRRRRLEDAQGGFKAQAKNLVHNAAAALIVFQVVVLYTLAGYYKLTGPLWNTGVAMHYISNVTQFQMFGFYPRLMDNLWLGWLVTTLTVVFECAVPFIVFAKRAWLREIVTLGLEAMHVGIIVFMGLVPFGAIMIGADFALLRDSDYRGLGRRIVRMRDRRRQQALGSGPKMAVGKEEGLYSDVV